MARTLLFRMVFREFSEIFQYNIFSNHEYFFFQSAFWSLFNHSQRSQSNQEQCSLCCSLPCLHVLLCTHYGLLQCFWTYFRKLKGIRVLQSIFQDYAISCDYGFIKQVATLSDQICLGIIFLLFDFFCFSRIYLQTTQNIM